MDNKNKIPRRIFERKPNEPKDLEPLLTLEQAEPLLGYTHWSLRQLVKNGRLSCIRFGQKILLEPSEIRRFLTAARRHRV